MGNHLIYLDNNATTKCAPEVVEAMIPFLSEYYGNAASKHDLGIKSNEAVNKARKQVADLIEASEGEIFFTSGATESINIALKGVVTSSQKTSAHIITCVTEHPAVLDTCRVLESQGVEVTYLPVSKEGLIDLHELSAAIRETTILVCLMMVNNETGVIHPIKQAAEIAHARGIFFMSDATQAVGKINVPVYDLGIDILCFSGHKLHGPKGVGGLFLRSKKPFKVKIPALIHGGGQEKGLRSGTLNVPGIVGLGAASESAKKWMATNHSKIEKLRDRLEKTLLGIQGAFINGAKDSRIYTTCNIGFEGVDADALIVGLKNVAVSNGSACSSTSIDPSHVLKAMGRTDAEAFSSVRFSLSRFTTEAEIEPVTTKVTNVVSQLREMVKR